MFEYGVRTGAAACAARYSGKTAFLPAPCYTMFGRPWPTLGRTAECLSSMMCIGAPSRHSPSAEGNILNSIAHHPFVFITLRLRDLHLRHPFLEGDEGCEYFVVDIIVPFVDRYFRLTTAVDALASSLPASKLTRDVALGTPSEPVVRIITCYQTRCVGGGRMNTFVLLKC